MKGIIFNLLETVVRQHHGEETWETLLDAAGLEGVYTSLGNYGDAEMMRLVAAASRQLDLPPEAVLRWFGRNALPILAAKYPHFFTPGSAREFLMTLNDIIHSEVRKLYAGAEVPEFDFEPSSPEVLLLGYRSRRRLCALAEGFVEGTASYYKEQVSIEQPRCMHRGDDRCLIRIAFRNGSR